MSDVTFDPEIVRADAARRLSDARWLPRNWAIMGALMGYVLGAAVAGGASVPAAVTTLLVGAMGFVVGRDQAARARVEVQLALCQLQIEAHSRAWVSEARVSLRQLAQVAIRQEASGASPEPQPTASSALPPATVAPTETSGSRSGRSGALRRPQGTANVPAAPAAPAWEEVPLPTAKAFEATYVTFAARRPDVVEEPELKTFAATGPLEAPSDEAPPAEAAEGADDEVISSWYAEEYGETADLVSGATEDPPSPREAAPKAKAAGRAGKRPRRAKRPTGAGSRG